MISLRVKNLLNIILVLSIIIIPSISFGQIGVGLNNDDINISIDPESPEPYQNVTIKLQSYIIDLDKSIIEWKNGSKILLSGYGKTEYSFTNSGPNTNTIIIATIKTPDSIELITKTINVGSSEIEVLWESANGYVPPFYKGKSFIAPGGSIKVVAIPNTTNGNKGNFTYNWRNADSAVQNNSGYNKNSYIFKNSELTSAEEVSVAVSSVNGKYNATKTIYIPTTSPKMIFYKKSPTDGILYNNALSGSSIMAEDEMTIKAEPYFISQTGNDSDYSYDWKINGTSIETPSKKTELTVRPASRGGNASISFTMENLRTFLQKAYNQLNLTL